MGRLTHPFIAELKRFVANQNATLGPIVMLLSDVISIPDKFTPKHQEIRLKQKKLSEITDMIHAAHVFHRCVRDNTSRDSNDSNSKRLHQDNVMSLLIGDYLLAQSSVDMADLRYPRTVGLIAKGLEDYTRGEFLKLQLIDNGYQNLEETHKIIEEHAELTCGSLLSNACLSAALIAGYDDKSYFQPGTTLIDKMFSIGYHAGTAHRLLELLYYPNANSEEEKVLVHSLESSRFVYSVHHHIDQSINILHEMRDCEKRSELLAILKKMKDKCYKSSTSL